MSYGPQTQRSGLNANQEHLRKSSGVLSGGGLGEEMSQDMKDLVQPPEEQENLQDSEPMQELEPNV